MLAVVRTIVLESRRTVYSCLVPASFESAGIPRRDSRD